MNRTLTMLMHAVLAFELVACSGGDEASDAPEATPAVETGGAASGQDMMDQMMAHVDRMRGMPSDSVSALLPTHRQMVGNMLAQMNADMRAMNMASDATWNALVDSLRADVIALPELSAEELQNAMGPHLDRVARILDSHAAMMRAMRM